MPLDISRSAYYRKYALLVAVENYQDTRIKRVQFAEADAQEMAEALGKHGFGELEILPSSKATKVTIESRIRKISDKMTESDEFCFFFAGHGFSEKGHNFLMCHDSQYDDLQSTSIRLQDVFAAIRNSKCKRAIFFLDACASGVEFPANERAVFSDLNEGELETFLRESEYQACFTACRSHEVSQSATGLGHGVWTYHLIKALNGEDKLALEQGGLISSTSLQDYLSQEVPRTLRRVLTNPKKQTPWFYGALNRSFVIADAAPLLAQKESAQIGHTDLKRVALKSTESTPVRLLRGFQKKFHSVPSHTGTSAQSFIERLARDELQAEIDSLHEKLRDTFGYVRRDLQSSVELGGGSIITPDFTYSVNISQDPEDPSQAVWYREVLEITNPAILEDPRFEAVFKDSFNSVNFDFYGKTNIGDLIDALEAKGVRPRYPSNYSWCEVDLPSSNATLRITPSSLTLNHPQPVTPKKLLASLSETRQQLATQVDAKTLPLSREPGGLVKK